MVKVNPARLKDTIAAFKNEAKRVGDGGNGTMGNQFDKLPTFIKKILGKRIYKR